MGFVYAELELVSIGDRELCRRGFIKTDAIRKVKVQALVDSGAYQMIINELIKEQLDLQVIETRLVTLSDESVRSVEIVGPLEVHFQNRMTLTSAVVLPGIKEVLLGSIPMEDLDVVIDPKRQTLEVNPEHPDVAVSIVKNIRGLSCTGSLSGTQFTSDAKLWLQQ